MVLNDDIALNIWTKVMNVLKPIQSSNFSYEYILKRNMGNQFIYLLYEAISNYTSRGLFNYSERRNSLNKPEVKAERIVTTVNRALSIQISRMRARFGIQLALFKSNSKARLH
ncbi:hypothetical protein CEXT_384891 [Caerostris extrusa]|uniref:Ribosomal protein S3 n=1 Tax=Caerostris extrusa TaxID=172846 RepID=A0AAV4QVK9_CAEEX|nr:hypothetical protein CEXT_384891 [Caerostris extrusa]